MKPSVRQMLLLFYVGATAFVALVAAVAVYLHTQRAQPIVEFPEEGPAKIARQTSLQRAIPASAAFALFAPSPAAAFDAWGACANGLQGSDSATAWLQGTFGDDATLARVLARYRVDSDAPMAVFLEFQPVDRQFETHFAVVLGCTDPEGFVKSAWPIDPAASAAPRLLAERRGYTLALHGSLVCASWPDWIAISDSMSFATAVAESFHGNEAAIDTLALGESSAAAFLFPGRLRPVWSPVAAWLRVAWPPFSPQLAALCDLLEPANSDRGPITVETRVWSQGMEARASWSAIDCPGLSALLGGPPWDASHVLTQNPDASVSASIALGGAIGSAVKTQLRHLAAATNDADTVAAIERIAGQLSTEAAFEIGPFEGEKIPLRAAWRSDDIKNALDALTSILPVVQGAESVTDGGATVYAARVIQPVYFGGANGLVVLASDANDVRELLSASRHPSGSQNVVQRASIRLRGAYLAQLVEETGLNSSTGHREEVQRVLSRVTEGGLTWDATPAAETVTLRVDFAAPD